MAYPSTPITDPVWEGNSTLLQSLIDNEIIGKVNTHMADAQQHSPASTLTANPQTGTAYTLVLADAGKIIEMDNAAANTITIPTNASVAIPVGSVLQIYQAGVGMTTVTKASGVTLRNESSLRARYSVANLWKRATNEWVLSGDIL